MKTFLIVVIILVLLAGVLIALNRVDLVEPTPSPNPSLVPSATATPEYGTTGNIHVFKPEPKDEIGLPVVIQGEARTFEAAFSYRIKNSKGTVLVEGNGMTTGIADYPEFRPFEVSVNYDDPKTASGSVEVFERSAKDGSEINKVVVPVMFKKDVSSTEVKLYLKLDAPITVRIAKSDTPVRATLDELLTRMGGSIKINSVNLKSGILTVDVTSVLDATAISQITKTAMQYASVKSVVLTVNGSR